MCVTNDVHGTLDTLLFLSRTVWHIPMGPWLCLSRCLQPCWVDELHWRVGPTLSCTHYWSFQLLGNASTGQQQQLAGRRGERQLERDRSEEGEIAGGWSICYHQSRDLIWCPCSTLHKLGCSDAWNLASPRELCHREWDVHSSCLSCGFTWLFQTQPWSFKQHHSEKELLSTLCVISHSSHNSNEQSASQCLFCNTCSALTETAARRGKAVTFFSYEYPLSFLLAINCSCHIPGLLRRWQCAVTFCGVFTY